jgi:hypothetical protein
MHASCLVLIQTKVLTELHFRDSLFDLLYVHSNFCFPSLHPQIIF